MFARKPDFPQPTFIEVSPIEAALLVMVQRDNDRMRRAGTKLAEAALHVIREHDGCHRLALAVAEWATAVASEGDRDVLHGKPTSATETPHA